MVFAKKTQFNKKFIIATALIVLIFLFFILRSLPVFERNTPLIDVDEILYSNLKNDLMLKFSDDKALKDVRVSLQVEDKAELIFEQKNINKKEFLAPVSLPKTIRNNANSIYTLVIEVRDNSWSNFFSGNVSKKALTLVVDTKAPKLRVLSNSYQVERGGAASVVFEANDEMIDELYIQVGDKHFKALPYIKEGFYAALIAWDLKQKDFRAYIVAKDKAGNESKEYIPFYLRDRKYRESNIKLSDRFLDGKIQSLASEYAPKDSDFTRLENFKFVNETLRISNEEKIYKLSSVLSENELKDFQINLFLPLKNGAKVADFGDHRFYSYEGNFVSDSYHMGLDLASVKEAPIISNNSGKVVFAEENGIYGLNILLYHGFGLYSLYGHCSSSPLKAGEEVAVDEIIAKTGVSGLALGDHLHFGILVQGVEVRPEQFQDRNWIKNNITKVLDEGKKIIGG